MALGHKKGKDKIVFGFHRSQEVNFHTLKVLEQAVLISELTDNTNRKEYYQIRIHWSSRTDGEWKWCQVVELTPDSETH